MTDKALDLKFVQLSLEQKAQADADKDTRARRKLDRAVGNMLHILERFFSPEVALEIEAIHRPWQDEDSGSVGIIARDWIFMPPATCNDETEEFYLSMEFEGQRYYSQHWCKTLADVGKGVQEMLSWRASQIAEKEAVQTQELSATETEEQTWTMLSPIERLKRAMADWADNLEREVYGQ